MDKVNELAKLDNNSFMPLLYLFLKYSIIKYQKSKEAFNSLLFFASVPGMALI